MHEVNACRCVYACIEYEITERIFMEFGIGVNAKVFWAKLILVNIRLLLPIRVAAWSKVWICWRSLAGIAGSNSAGSVVWCQIEVSALG